MTNNSRKGNNSEKYHWTYSFSITVLKQLDTPDEKKYWRIQVGRCHTDHITPRCVLRDDKKIQTTSPYDVTSERRQEDTDHITLRCVLRDAKKIQTTSPYDVS
jgi:uncharacterized protein affecting Mg2+/Co2+ transport